MNSPSPTLVTLAALLCGPWLCSSAYATGDDNFNDNAKDPAKWGTDVINGNGVLTETNQRLQYTCASPTLDDQSERPWNLTRFPFNSDWEMQIETSNTTTPFPPLQVNSMGITLMSPLSASNYLYHELYSSALGGPSITGANADLVVGDVSVGGNDTGDLAITVAALRLRWNSSTKVLTCDYDTNPADGFQWIELASCGLAGSGGATANANWGLAASDQFFVSVYGYSAAMTVAAGQMYLDNFQETGGVASSGGSRPEPTGSFQFAFPRGNDLLTRIISLTGNYQGISPTPAQRNYNIDVAQDESGKIAIMGVVDGVTDSNGNTAVAAKVGSVKTVNGEPVAELKGNFKGTVDGAGATYKGSAIMPVEVVDLGGGVDGVMGTATYSSKVAGVPFAGRNVPVEFAAPPGATDNLQQDWSLQLDLAPKLFKSRECIVASATLVLPNGDTIRYPEKVVKYSQKSGYQLSFKKGTNLTANPDRIDKKSTIQLTNLKFVQQGNSWQPSAGTITYRFLGQKGHADLMEFVAPDS